MSYITKIGVFILFLITYSAFLWVANVFLQKMKRNLLNNKSFWNGQLSILLAIVPFFLFTYLLSGSLSLPLVILFLAGAQLGVIIGATLWGFLGSTTDKWGAHGMWAGGEFALKHPWLMLLMLFLTSLMVLAYPIIAGIAYFTLPSEELPTRMFQYTLVAVIFSGYPLMLITVLGILTSENIDEETRSRYFTSQVSQLILTALFLSLAFWAFGIGEAGSKLAISGISLALSPQLLLFLVLFFIFTILLPYLIGVQRGKKWRVALLKKQDDWLSKLLTILQAPTGSLYVAKLNQLQAELTGETDAFSDGDMMVKGGILIDQNATPEQLVEIAPAYRLSRGLDPRFKYLDWLHQFANTVQEIIGDIEQTGTEAEREKAGESWAKIYLSQRETLAKDIASVSQGKPPVWVGVGAIITPIISAILSEVAKWLWVVFSQSSPK